MEPEGKFILRTERLELREMMPENFNDLCTMLCDEKVMYAWEHAFSPGEVQEWIARNLKRYRTDGCGYWLAFERASGECVGQIGLIEEEIFGVRHLGIGWILARRHWHRGYAAEGARACLDYAFRKRNAPRVVADIRPGNAASSRVAEKLGMKPQGVYEKHYNGKIMPHRLFVISTPQVAISEYDPRWPDAFARLSELLAPLVRRFGGRIEHVGSTGVPDLAAKPVIDADYIPADFSAWPAIRKALEQYGFFHRGDGGLPGREMFTESLRLEFRHHFYCCNPDSPHLKNHLKLRDYLRTHPESARRYGALKKKLAAEFPEDIDSYCAGKSALLAEFLEKIGFDAAQIADIAARNEVETARKIRDGI